MKFFNTTIKKAFFLNIFCISNAHFTDASDTLLSAAKDSIFGAPQNLMSSILNTAATGQTAQAAGGLTGTLTNAFSQVKNTVTSKIEWTTQLIPIANFIFNFPQVLISSFLNNKYDDSKFLIINKDSSGDSQKDYGIEFDFKFEGSGNINQPFNFIFMPSALKYYYQSISGKFVPEKFLVKNTDGTVTSAQRTDFRQPPFSTILPALLNQLFGQGGLDAWKQFNRMLFLYPEDVALIKIMSLMSSAYKNSSNNEGYPRIAHVPLELSILFSRMAKTPDIKATQALYPQGTSVNNWDPTNMKFLENGPAVFINNLPEALKSSINGIAFPVSEGELQEFNDMKSKGLSPAQTLYGQIRSTQGYNQRSSFILEKVLPFITKNRNITKTEADILMFGIKLHCCERMDSFYNFFISSTSALQDFNGELIGSAEDVALGIDSLFQQATMKFSNVSEERIKKVLDGQADLLKNLLQQTINTFSAAQKISSFDIAFLETEKKLLETESVTISQNIGAVSKAILTLDKATFSDKMQILKDSILKVFNKKFSLQQISSSGQKIQQQLSDYLAIRYFQFEKLNYKKFDGDNGYFKDDAPMDTETAGIHCIGIILRAMKDLMTAEILFKNDNDGQQMMTPSGSQELIRGSVIYKDYMEKPLYYKTTVESEVAALKSQVATQSTNLTNLSNASGLTPQEINANDRLAKAEQYYQSLNSVYLSYLRQFKFDRRDLSGQFAGQPFNVENLKNIVKTKDQIDSEDILNAAQKMISSNSIQGATAQVKIDALLYKKQLEQTIANLEKTETKMPIEGVIASTTNSIQIYTGNLTKLTTSKADLSTKIAAASKDATATTQLAAYNQQMTTIDSLINQTTQMLNSAKEGLALNQSILSNINENLTLYKNCLNEITKIISNIPVTAKNLDEAFPASGFNLKSHDIKTIVSGKESVQKIQVNQAIKQVQITDSTFLKTIIKVRELVASGQSSTNLTSEINNTSGFTAATDMLERLIKTCENALQISSDKSLLGTKFTDAKNAAASNSAKILNQLADFRTIEKDFTAAIQKTQNIDVLSKTPNLLPALARACAFAVLQILSSSIGQNLFKYLKESVIPALNSDTPVVLETSTGTESDYQKTVDALTQTNSNATPASAITESQKSELADLIRELKAAIENPAVWTSAFWENDIFINPNKLPLMIEERLDIIKSGAAMILVEKKSQLTISDRTFLMLKAIIILIFNQLSAATENENTLQSVINSWLPKIKTAAASNSQIDVATLDNLNKLWAWLQNAMPSILSYARFMLESGTKTSVNQFLAKEIANVLKRAPGFAKVANLYLDPILIKSIGVNTQTLIDSSIQDQQAMALQQVAIYSSELNNLSANSIETLDTIAASAVNSLDDLAKSQMAIFESTTYDITTLEKELGQMSTTMTMPNTDFMLSSQDFENYFDSLSSGSAIYNLEPKTSVVR